jgi:hypothetical protein
MVKNGREIQMCCLKKTKCPFRQEKFIKQFLKRTFCIEIICKKQNFWNFDLRASKKKRQRWPFFEPFLANVAIFQSHFLEKNDLAISWILAILWLFLRIVFYKNYWWLFCGYIWPFLLFFLTKMAIFSNFNLATLPRTKRKQK